LERRRSLRESEKMRRARRIRREVREATIAVHQEGSYPGNNQVKACLRQPALLREPAGSAAWRHTLAELGGI
jgi:hypothetical protein